MAEHTQISWWSVLKGALFSPPRPTSLLRGLWWLVRFRPDTPWSIGALLQERARQWPDQVAIQYLDQRWTYRQFNAWVNRIAGVLAQQGVGPGVVVGIVMENRPELLACVAATVKLGAMAAMLNHHQQGQTQAHSIAATQPKLFMVDEAGAQSLLSAGYGPNSQSRTASHTCFEVMSTAEAPDSKPPACQGMASLAQACATQSSDNPASAAKVQLGQPCFYILTSGTSGLPKASVMTHYRWMRAAAGIGGLSARLSRSDVLYLPLPLYHNNGLTVSWGSVLAAGATLALSRRFSAKQFWAEARHHGATAFCYVGEICRYLLEQAPSEHDQQHQITLAMGNGLRADIWPKFQSRFNIGRISEFYAASECNLVFVNAFNIEGTAGFCPLTYAIIAVDADECIPIRDEHGRGQRVGAGGTGLLVTQVSDRMPFDGYTDARATEQKLLRHLFEEGDCWFSTGDLVKDQGWRHIQFVDRLGDTFRWKGENVATTEVERAVDQFPQVQESVVYGVAIPGCEGRAGMAAVRLADGEDAFQGAALAKHLQATLPAYAVPLFIRLRQQQALTHTFKHRKSELKDEGFDPVRCAEPVYVLSPHHQGYVPLSPEIWQQIQDRSWRW